MVRIGTEMATLVLPQINSLSCGIQQTKPSTSPTGYWMMSSVAAVPPVRLDGTQNWHRVLVLPFSEIILTSSWIIGMETPSICWMTKAISCTPCRIRQRIPSGILPTPYLRMELTGRTTMALHRVPMSQRIGQDLVLEATATRSRIPR